MVTQAEVDANYNMDMWVKECDKGIVSCFEAKVGHEQSISSARYLNYQPFSSQLTRATMTTNCLRSVVALARLIPTMRNVHTRNRLLVVNVFNFFFLYI